MVDTSRPADPMTDHRTVTVETLAAALTDSGLIKRLTDYAIRAHPETMTRDEPNVAQSWAADIFAALPATPAATEPREDRLRAALDTLERAEKADLTDQWDEVIRAVDRAATQRGRQNAIAALLAVLHPDTPEAPE